MTAEEIHEHTAKNKCQHINPVNEAVRFTKKQQAIKTIDKTITLIFSLFRDVSNAQDMVFISRGCKRFVNKIYS